MTTSTPQSSVASQSVLNGGDDLPPESDSSNAASPTAGIVAITTPGNSPPDDNVDTPLPPSITCCNVNQDGIDSSSDSEALDTTPVQEITTESEVKPSVNKRRRLIKTEEDKIPLPTPFPLPKFYRPDVDQALEKKSMTIETTKAFYHSVASSMFVYKKYPTQDDYVTVGRAIIEKYPFFTQPIGTPYVSVEYITSPNSTQFFVFL